MFFWKKDKLANLLKKAFLDPNCRLEFYKVLLESEVYLLLDMQANTQKGKMDVVTWQQKDGSQIIPLFTSKDEMKKTREDLGKYSHGNARELFETNSNSDYVINPGSEYSKELIASEISSLLSGAMFRHEGIELRNYPY